MQVPQSQLPLRCRAPGVSWGMLTHPVVDALHTSGLDFDLLTPS